MNESEKMTEVNKKALYASYLKTMGFVSLFTVAIELSLFIARLNDGELSGFQKFFSLVSIIILFVNVAIGFLIPENEFFKEYRESLQKLITGRTVSILFFSHMICASLFIFQDGGVQSSCVSSVLLLDASFGSIFANKKYMKVLVTVSCLSLYVLTFLYNYSAADKEVVPHYTYDIFPYLLTVVFVLLCNVIINQYSIEKAKGAK